MRYALLDYDSRHNHNRYLSHEEYPQYGTVRSVEQR